MAHKRLVVDAAIGQAWEDHGARSGLGPDALRIPSEPQRLRHALDLLGQLSGELDRSRTALDEAAGDDDVRGETAHALQRVVRFSRFTARRDRDLLDDLAQAVQHLVEVLGQVQGGEMEQLRTRWETARHELVAAARAKDHERPGQLVAALDAQVTEPYRQLFRRLHGALPEPEAHLLAVDDRLEAETRTYKQAARGALEEFQHAVQRVRQAEEAVRAHLAWEPREKRQPEDVPAGGAHADKDPVGISGPRVLNRLRSALDQGADALEHAIPQLGPIARSIEDGLLPDHDEQHQERRAFREEWEQHLQRRIKRMRFVSTTSDKMAHALAKLDESTAAEIFKDQDDD